MRNQNPIILLLLTAVLLESCGIFGIHFKVHNPSKPGKTPQFSEETILLGEMTRYRSCYDVHYYDLSLNIDPSQKSLNGTVAMHAITVENCDTIQIDLHRNFEITRLIDKESGADLKYQRKERAVFIHYPKRKGETFVLQIEYRGKPPVAKKPPWKGGFVWKKDKEGNPWIGVACESEGASIWWPLKDHTADEPDSMRIHYAVPNGLTAVGNGRLEGKTENGSTTTFNWFVSYPINTYNVTLYVGKFKLIEDEYTGVTGKKLSLNHYVLKKNYETAKEHFKQLHPQLRLYEKRFGEYPWYRDGFKLVESPYAGMEHQSAIAYGNGYKNDKYTGTDYIILHETAHEWWGNSLSAKDLADAWLHEGFATYSEALYFEHKIGQNGYQYSLNLYKLFIKNKYPVVVVKGRRWFHFRKNADVYSKGAWILHTLRGQIDDDALFFAILKTYSEKFRYQVVASQDFIDVVNELTKTDYSWFFEQYLFNNYAPELEYTLSSDGLLHYRWTKTNPSFDQLKVKVISGPAALVLTPTSKIQTVKLSRNVKGAWDYKFMKEALYATQHNKKLLKTAIN